MSTEHSTKPETHDIDLGTMYTRSELFFEKNKKAVTIGAIAVLVIVGGALGYKRWIADPKAKTAQDMMWKAQYYFEMDSVDLAINGDGNYNGFAYIANEYSGTPSGKLANLYLGVCYHQKGEYEQALECYKKADVKDDVLRVMAEGNQGDVLVELGRPDEAVEKFERAASMVQSDYTTPLFLMKAGTIYQQKSDWKNAAKCFERVATDFPSYPEASTAKKYAAQAKALSGQS